MSGPTRRRLARKAFATTAAADMAIAGWLDVEPVDDLPATLQLALRRAQPLRYGENPHQLGARYRFEGGRSWWDDAVQHGGKELSYLNLYDTEAAWRSCTASTTWPGHQARQPVWRAWPPRTSVRPTSWRMPATR